MDDPVYLVVPGVIRQGGDLYYIDFAMWNRLVNKNFPDNTWKEDESGISRVENYREVASWSNITSKGRIRTDLYKR